jgi:hypothetical protein
MSDIHPEVMDEIEKEREKQQSLTETLENIEDKPTSVEGESSVVIGGWKIVTGLGDKENMKKIIDGTLFGYHKEMEESLVIIFGGNTKAQYPEIRISGNSFVSSHDVDTPDPKFFSMIVPTDVNGEYRYFLRKGVGKAKNDSMLELTESEINEICEIANQKFFPFLQSIQGKFFKSVKDFDDKLPESVTIRDGKTTKIVFKIDEGSLVFKKDKTTAMPNMSVRVWEFGFRNGWHAKKPGVTMSCFNFFLLVNAAFKNFIPDVKSLVQGYFSSMKQIKQAYEQSSDENMDDDIEPLIQ